MATFSDAQFNHFMEQMRLNQAGAQRVDRTPSNRKTIELRHLHLKDFEGEAGKYGEWAFSFRRAIRSCNTKVFTIFEQIELHKVGVNEDQIHQKYFTSEFEDPLDIHKISAELYDVLSSVCTNDALAVVRSVDTCQGFVAWHRLHMKYNPRTMARAIRLLGEVCNPQKCRDVQDVENTSQTGKPRCAPFIVSSTRRSRTP